MLVTRPKILKHFPNPKKSKHQKHQTKHKKQHVKLTKHITHSCKTSSVQSAQISKSENIKSLFLDIINSLKGQKPSKFRRKWRRLDNFNDSKHQTHQNKHQNIKLNTQNKPVSFLKEGIKASTIRSLPRSEYNVTGSKEDKITQI